MKKSFENFKRRLSEFMYGRYGTDELYFALFVLFIILFVLNFFLGIFVGSTVVSAIMSLLMWAVIGYSIFRSFSKNIEKRRKENLVFIRAWAKIKGFFTGIKNRFRDRKTHVYRKCPSCKATIRFPKKKGKHSARCPKCGANFEVRV